MESDKDRKIRERAYELWEQSGRQEGDSERHWLQAEQEFAADSESPEGPTSNGARTSPVKKTTRARSTAASESKAEKPAAIGTGAKRQTAKSSAKSGAAKPASA